MATGSIATRAVNWDSVYAIAQQGYATVRPAFERGCYDCHSAQTHYPWYYKLPLVKSKIDGDIRQARRQVDFTDGFPFKSRGMPADALDAIRDEITSGDMPPWEYRLFHWDAKPAGAEADSVSAWIERSLALLAAHGQFPAGKAAAKDSAGAE